MTKPQERKLVEEIIAKLWGKVPKAWGCTCLCYRDVGSCDCFSEMERLDHVVLDMNLAGEVMKRMKKLGYQWKGECTWEKWWSAFRLLNGNTGLQIPWPKLSSHKRHELAILLAAKSALEAK